MLIYFHADFRLLNLNLVQNNFYAFVNICKTSDEILLAKQL